MTLQHPARSPGSRALTSLLPATALLQGCAQPLFPKLPMALGRNAHRRRNHKQLYPGRRHASRGNLRNLGGGDHSGGRHPVGPGPVCYSRENNAYARKFTMKGKQFYGVLAALLLPFAAGCSMTAGNRGGFRSRGQGGGPCRHTRDRQRGPHGAARCCRGGLLFQRPAA
jgi:hypothetical protein